MKKIKLLVTTLVSILATCGCNNEVSSSTSSISSSTLSESTSSSLVTYDMLVKTINNNILKKVSIDVFNGEELIETLTSDFYGKASITLNRGEYTARLKNLPSGMYNHGQFQN